MESLSDASKLHAEDSTFRDVLGGLDFIFRGSYDDDAGKLPCLVY